MYKLIPVVMLRGSNGLYYQASDKVPDNAGMGTQNRQSSSCCTSKHVSTHNSLLAGFNKVKQLSFRYLNKKVRMRYAVPEELVRNVLNT
jgi:hypothetical protein